MDILEWLTNWYSDHCDGDWEHEKRIHIGTLDNPGWSVEINIADTELEEASFSPLIIERSEHDWIHCKVEEKVFKGDGGPKNLQELLEVFRQWALSQASIKDT